MLKNFYAFLSHKNNTINISQFQYLSKDASFWDIRLRRYNFEGTILQLCYQQKTF